MPELRPTKLKHCFRGCTIDTPCAPNHGSDPGKYVMDPIPYHANYQFHDGRQLLPAYTRELRSANNLGAIAFNRWIPQYLDLQTPNRTIEQMWVERGGLQSRNYANDVWRAGQTGPAGTCDVCVPAPEQVACSLPFAV